ncbi:Peptidase C13 family protein [Fasciola hepatica]|uniref:Peptidase C13 family protein n=1 Tax=Fasciola hepatica TaxID=6192 RepID=A0A4E0QU43_FASHE|nr:Peptidase C13 family protein [Fasciola hepatica]
MIFCGPEDNVFIYFSDHGSPNTIEFPSGELSAKQLNETLAYMNKARLYKKMVIYIEACYSGSMFRRILPENIDILAVTAAHEDESSWATFCDDPKIDTCLADEFSYQWMTDTEKHQRDLSKWTVGKQFRAVKQAVKKSHVMRYGDWVSGAFLLSSVCIIRNKLCIILGWIFQCHP